MDSSGYDASAGESVSVSSGGTWVLPRPAWWGDGVYGMGQRLMDAVLHPDFGPPPDWLPGALYRFWPTGGVHQGGGGGGVRGGENMSQYSGDDSHSMSGMQSPARSVASLSGKGGGAGAGTTTRPQRRQLSHPLCTANSILGLTLGTWPWLLQERVMPRANVYGPRRYGPAYQRSRMLGAWGCSL